MIKIGRDEDVMEGSVGPDVTKDNKNLFHLQRLKKVSISKYIWGASQGVNRCFPGKQ